MALPLPAPVIIACPQCGTRYQLDRAVLGEHGRIVQCAKCQHEWEARAPELPPQVEADAIFEDAEALLDAQFAREAAAAAAFGQGSPAADLRSAIAPRPRVDPDSAQRAEAALLHRHKQAFSRRRQTLHRQLPLARFRSAARVAAVGGLVLLVAGGVVWRQPLVEQFPDLAGVYAMAGLPVNVVGLEFADVRTLETLSEGSVVLTVSGRIVQVSDRLVSVPAVVVTLLGKDGSSLYEWSVTPDAHDLAPGEAVAFETRLTRPPPGAERLRLSFANARARPQAAAALPEPQPETTVGIR